MRKALEGRGTRVAIRVVIRSAALLALLLFAAPVVAQSNVEALEAEVRSRSAAVAPRLIEWRRDIHAHPELGDQEKRTAGLVAKHLRSLGLEVQTGVARTGVVGILKGGRPGPTVALRADMDALPGKEETGLPFASRATGTMYGKDVPVMHACGHDAHTAMLMATAEVLAGMRKDLPGTVVFIFQPAEEGSSLYPPGSKEKSGALLMLEEGLFERTKPDAVFAMHVMPGPSGEISFRSGAVTASSDSLRITITGKQGHGGMPWSAIDPIPAAALVVSSLQTVVSRRANLTASPAVVTIGTIEGGSRENIIADKVEMTGTMRAHNEDVRAKMKEDVRTTVEHAAQAAGAKGVVTITDNYATTMNDDALTKDMAPVIERAADGRVAKAPLSGASEDFSFFAKRVPGLYIFLGATPRGEDPAKAAPNHNPKFFVDEAALEVGTRVMSTLAVNYLANPPKEVPEKESLPFVQDPESPEKTGAAVPP